MGWSMLFDVAGPFKLERYGKSKKKILTDDTAYDLKERLEDWKSGLSEACGCYVFAVRASKGLIPYYIGQACKRSLLKEAMNPSNIGKYNKVLSNRDGGTPIIYFLPLVTPAGRFRKRKTTNGGLPALDFLERWLIAAALEKNPHLVNNK